MALQPAARASFLPPATVVALALSAGALLVSLVRGLRGERKPGDRVIVSVSEKALLGAVERGVSSRHLSTVGRRVTPRVEDRFLKHFDWLSDVAYQEDWTILISAEDWAGYGADARNWYGITGRLRSEGVEFVVLRRSSGVLYCYPPPQVHGSDYCELDVTAGTGPQSGG